MGQGVRCIRYVICEKVFIDLFWFVIDPVSVKSLASRVCVSLGVPVDQLLRPPRPPPKAHAEALL